MTLVEAAAAPAEQVLRGLDATPDEGLTASEVLDRRATQGANVLRTHRVSAAAVLGRQLRSPLLVLLAVAGLVSFFVGQGTDSVVIGLILLASVGLGFVNEYRAEQAGAALHDRLRHEVVVVRAGRPLRVDVSELVPGDLVRLELGAVVPADVRLLATSDLECDESVLTGESRLVVKSDRPVAPGSELGDLTSCALMGTVVRAGSGLGVVVATGPRTEFGRIALELGERQPETEFQVGLREFSMLLVRIAGALTTAIFIINLVLHRPVLDAVLFSLAIAVGITPQLLPAVVAASLAIGSRRLADCKVLVKRLVCIEDLGDVEVLFTDKTGTLTDGRISLLSAEAAASGAPETVVLMALLANEATLDRQTAIGGNPIDAALWESALAEGVSVAAYRRRAIRPFDHVRRRTTVLVDGPVGRLLVCKGAPEEVMGRCSRVPATANDQLEAQLREGNRVVVVASRPMPGATALHDEDEQQLDYVGLLSFSDAPKQSARVALERLRGLGIDVKITTGDHPVVAQTVCARLGLEVTGVLTGAQVSGLDDTALRAAIQDTTVFARVSPDEKARIIRAQRSLGLDVAYLGDGVNDALALHAADIGISVASGVDVAKDAADVVLLEKDLGVLADGVVEGRRIFANTIKYVFMGTSSNFGNMFSAAGASAFLPFLPMLPSQILLNNLLYDVSQMGIPTDNVDPEQLVRPAHWDMRQIRRFMFTFGPLSSLFDFMTFAILISVLHAGATLFRTGWFVESLATQTLVVFVIRTHHSPWRSRPSWPLLAGVLGVVAVGLVIPYSPVAAPLGFTALPIGFLGILLVLVVGYLLLVEAAKRELFSPQELPRLPAAPVPIAPAGPVPARIQRRAARFASRERIQR